MASTGWKGGKAIRPGAAGKAFSPNAKFPGIRIFRTPPVYIPTMPGKEIDPKGVNAQGVNRLKKETGAVRGLTLVLVLETPDMEFILEVIQHL